jgi:hypothetical protein
MIAGKYTREKGEYNRSPLEKKPAMGYIEP